MHLVPTGSSYPTGSMHLALRLKRGQDYKGGHLALNLPPMGRGTFCCFVGPGGALGRGLGRVQPIGGP